MAKCVASCIRYIDREDLTKWLKNFDTKYTKQELDEIYSKARQGSYLVWTEDQGLFIY